MKELYHSEISKKILDAAYKVHSNLGPGLLESVYETCLAYELVKLGCKVQTQVGLPLVYEGIQMPIGFRIDIWVDEKIVIEVKSVEALADVHFKQLFTYLRLSESKVGFLINFNVSSLKDGIHRKVL